MCVHEFLIVSNKEIGGTVQVESSHAVQEQLLLCYDYMKVDIF